MSLVYPLLAISALVWLAITAAMLWLAWKLWMANKTADDRPEGANAWPAVVEDYEGPQEDSRGIYD